MALRYLTPPQWEKLEGDGYKEMIDGDFVSPSRSFSPLAASRSMRRTAFTLLELLLVLAIMTTLFGLGYATFRRQYARSQFKNGVFELQVDLARTRLLAMKTGTPYLFRFAPGTGVYEIVPVAALQEAIYRENGDFGDATSIDSFDAVGGSLSGALSVADDPNDSSDWGNLAYSTSRGGGSRFSDDLFSQENVAADVARFRGSASNGANFGATDFNALDSVVGLGATALGAEGASGFGAGVGGALDFSTSGAVDVGISFDAFSNGLGVSAATNFREPTVDEKSLLTNGSSLAWRVGVDGALFRKELTGDVVFTFGRVSKSTPANLKSRRPGGLAASNGGASDETGAVRSETTGSLTRLPNAETNWEFGTASDALVSGGLTPENGFNGINAAGAPPRLAAWWSEPVVFYPNGRTSTAVFGLASVGEYPYYSEISLRGMTGVARVSSISALPPGYDPGASALTQEELFRLSNPGFIAENVAANATGVDSSDVGATGALSGGALGEISDGLSSDGALESGSATGSVDLLFDSSFSNPTAIDEDGASGRRSGYRFDASPTGASGEGGPVGVPAETEIDFGGGAL